MGGALSRLSSTVTPARMRAAEFSRHSGNGADGWYVPDGWITSLTMAGYAVGPELALTLSHVYCAVSTISDDFGTMTCQLFRDLGNDGRARVRLSEGGIGSVAYKLRWQPNLWQSAKAFWSTLCWQYLLRPAAYAEIMYRPGSDSFVDQLIPRHPDRIEQQRVPSGRVRYKLTEADGSHRFITQDEMFVVRNTSTDGLHAVSRVSYGSRALATGIALQDFTHNYFKKGATASLLATYKGDGEIDDEHEAALHKSISRYVSGVENAGGIMLVPEDINVTSLGVNPEKSQLEGLKNLSGRDVARMFKMPPNWLAIENAQSYGSSVQDTQNYATRCQMPIVVEFEQAIQRDLIVARDLYFAKFNMDYLLRASLKERMESYEIGIRSRVLRPSEARVREDMSPDPRLDELSEQDHRAGSSKDGATGGRGNKKDARADVRTTLLVYDAAQRVVRRELAEVTKLAKRHADNPDGWQDGLRTFYAEYAGHIAEAMRLPIGTARAYAAQHGAQLASDGMAITTTWELEEAESLAALALEPVAA